MTKTAEIAVLMIMGAVVFCCLWVVGLVVHITAWYPDRVISPQVWGFAGGAWTILTVLGGAMINNVLAPPKQSAPSPPPAKQGGN